MTETRNCRVVVRVDGAPAPVYTSDWMTRRQAESLASDRRATIRARGWTHQVTVEER